MKRCTYTSEVLYSKISWTCLQDLFVYYLFAESTYYGA
jgi:hypothetical protein